jgi:single-stranded DNA-specific DHH superfamily exonuclease
MDVNQKADVRDKGTLGNNENQEFSSLKMFRRIKMLTKEQMQEIKEHLEKAQNPLFYYDNDCDGLCSYLLLRRYLGRGKGVAVRSFPDLNAMYARKARELNADYVFVLDKPVIAKEFMEEIHELGLPMVWIDHHNVDSSEFLEKFDNIFLYNPTKNEGKDESEEPVTYLVQSLLKRKEDLWIAVIGCIADHYLPEFAEEFGDEFREYWGKGIKKPFDAYYKTEIGKIAQGINYGLKDSTSNIVQLQNFLISCGSPADVFAESGANYNFRKKYKEIKKKYDALLEKAKKDVYENMIFFSYAGDLSISADISNELSYIFPDKYIVVAYKKGGVSNLSMRGKNVRAVLETVLEQFDDASGGGHEDAVGARIKTDDLERFKEIFGEEIK